MPEVWAPEPMFSRPQHKCSLHPAGQQVMVPEREPRLQPHLQPCSGSQGTPRSFLFHHEGSSFHLTFLRGLLGSQDKEKVDVREIVPSWAVYSL